MNLALWSEVARSLALFLSGLGAGMVTLELWQRRSTRGRPSLNRVLATAIMAVVTGASLLGVWNSYAMREQAQCQSRLNEQFLETLSNNAELTGNERENLDETIEDLAERSAGGQSSEEILRDYLAQRERIDQQRESYPEPPDEVCG